MNEPQHKPLLSAVFLATLLLGLLAALLNPLLLTSPEATVHDGRWTASYQESFSSEFPLLEPARSLWNAVDLAVFAQTPDGVVSGSEGWLFTEEEYAHAADPAGAHREWLRQIGLVHEELAADGIGLLVALVPAKASLLQELAPPLPDVSEGRYRVTLEGLAAAGIASVDLRPALAAADSWLRSDTHWTPEGAQSAAEAIAVAARELMPDMRADTAFIAESREPVTLMGDLARLLALGPFQQALGPPDLELTRLNVTRAADSGASLFDDVTVNLALVGTSYSAGELWNLADRLRLQLGAELVDASASGAGPLAPMREYMASDAFMGAPPRLVIWEIPERYLTDTVHLGDTS